MDTTITLSVKEILIGFLLYIPIGFLIAHIDSKRKEKKAKKAQDA